MAKLALINSQLNSEDVRALSCFGYDCVAMPQWEHLPFPMSTHPDMLVFAGFQSLFTHTKYYSQNKTLVDFILKKANLSLVLSDEEISERYPRDVLFNAALVGNKLICNPKYISKHILMEAQSQNAVIIPVNQGYTKCSVCIVDNSSIITSDAAIYSAVMSHGIDCLLISSGNIALPPYEYGFIGGASGYDGQNVYFCGNIKSHPDYDKISEFIKSKNKSIVCLNEHQLFDSGSILIL